MTNKQSKPTVTFTEWDDKDWENTRATLQAKYGKKSVELELLMRRARQHIAVLKSLIDDINSEHP